MSYPIVWIFLSLCLGVLLENLLNISWQVLFFFLTASIALEGYFFRIKKPALSKSFLLACFVFLSMLGFEQAKSLQFDSLKINPGKYIFSGKVVSFPVKHKNFLSYKVLINKITRQGQSVKTKDYVLARDYGLKDIEYGSRIVFSASLNKHSKGKYSRYIAWIKKNAFFEVLQPPGVLEKIAALLSSKIEGRFNKYLSAYASGFLSAVFLGRREYIFWDFRKYFINSGTAHILAVSGLHVGMVFVLVSMFLGFLGIRKKLRYALIIPFLVIYAFICGLRPPVMRAVLMAVIYCLYYVLERKPLGLCALALAGIIIFIINPLEYTSVSFILSFIGVGGLVLGFRALGPLKIKTAFLRYTIDLFLGSLLVNIFLFPVLVYFFGRFCFIGIAANLVIIPFLFLILFFTFIFLIFSGFSWLAQVLGQGLSFMVEGFIRLAQFLSWQGKACWLVRLGFWQVILYYLILFFIVWLMLQFKPATKKYILKG